MEGVVRVRTMDTKDDPSQTAMLIPGQQASVKNKGSKKITVQDADINKVMAWKNGLFNFENVSLADAMLAAGTMVRYRCSIRKAAYLIYGSQARSAGTPGLQDY